jgi:hypothetical protein
VAAGCEETVNGMGKGREIFSLISLLHLFGVDSRQPSPHLYLFLSLFHTTAHEAEHLWEFGGLIEGGGQL